MAITLILEVSVPEADFDDLLACHRRSVALLPGVVVQMLGGRTMKGKRAVRVGHRPPRASADGRGPRQGDRRLGVGGLHARALGPDHRRHRGGVDDGRCDRGVLRRARAARPRAAAREGERERPLRPRRRQADRALARHDRQGRRHRVAQERGGRLRRPDGQSAVRRHRRAARSNAMAGDAARRARRRGRPASCSSCSSGSSRATARTAPPTRAPRGAHA